MASRFSRRVRRPVAFLVTLAMAISAFSGGLMGFTAQAAQPDVTGIPANSAYVVYGDAATGTAASSNLTVDASAETTHQPTLQYIVDRYAMKCPDGTGNGNDWSYFYCKTGVDFQAQFTGTNNLTVSIDYYDDPALAGQKFEIWCNDNGGNSWPGVTMAGSGQWVTANLAVSNMTFGGINGGNDFRITSKTPNLAISRIVVTPGAVTLTPGGPDPIPRTASYTFGADLAGSVAKGMNLTGNTTDNGGAYDSFGTFGGKPAYVSIANTGDWNYIWYTLDSAYSQLPVADMTMVVTYFDASTAKGSTFNIWYKSFDGANVNDAWADTVTLQGTDTWQQAYCQLPAADVAETVQNGQNFRLTITSTQGTTGIPFSEADFYSYRVDAPPAPEQPKVSPDPVSVTFTGTDKDENGLEFYPMNDSPAENPGIYTTVDGQGAFQVNNPMRPDGDDAAYMWLRADADFASNASQTVTALVNYYDDPAHAGYNFEIWYVDTAGGNHWVPVTLAGTGEWKTAYMTLSNMKFGGVNNGFDFRLCSKFDGLALHQVTLYDGEVNPPVEGACYVTFGATQADTVTENFTYNGTSDTGLTGSYGTVAGETAYTTGDPNAPGSGGWQYIWGKMEKGFQTDTTMTLEVRYYDGDAASAGQGATWNIYYPGPAGESWTTTVALGYTGVWKTSDFTLRNVDFNNGQVQGNTFRFTVLGGGPVSVNHIELKNGGGALGNGVYLLFGDNQYQADGITWRTGDYGDGGTYASAGGQFGYAMNTNGKQDQYIYCNVDDGYMYGGKNKVQISVTYYDGAAGSWSMAYDSVDAAWSYLDAIQCKGSGQWLTKTYVLDDAAMSNRCNGSDMRIQGNGVIFQKITVEKILTVILEATPARDASVFYDTDSVTFGVKLTNQTAAAQKLTVNYNVVNPNGASIYNTVSDVSVAAGSVNNSTLDLGKLPKGSYFLNVNVTNADGSINITEQYRFGVITDLTNRTFTINSWGANAHYGQGQDKIDTFIPLYKQAGVTSIRDESSWGSVEQTPGNYTFNAPYIGTLSAAGVEPLIILAYGNNNYNSYDPAMIAAYGQYAYQMAKHYANVVNYFEVWNEFNGTFGNGRPDTYYLLLQAAYNGIQKANAETGAHAMCVACGVVGFDDAFIKSVASMGSPGQEGWRYMDAVSYHYPARDQVTSDALSIKQAIKDISKAADPVNYPNGKDVQAWITETGWSNEVPGGNTELQQAAYVGQLYLELASNPGATDMCYYYDFRNDGTDPSAHEQNFGVTDVTGAPKPSFVVLNALADQLNGRTAAAKYDSLRPNLQIHRFDGPSDTVYTLVSTLGDQSVSLNFGTDNFQVIDSYGNAVPYAIVNGTVNLTVGEIPMFVKGSFTTAPTVANATFTAGQAVVNVTPGEEATFSIVRSGDAVGYSGYYDVQLPLGWSVVSDTAFSAGTGATVTDTITVQVSGDYTAQTGKIMVTAKAMDDSTYATIAISTSTVDAFVVEVYPVAKDTNDGWDVAVKLDNNYNSATIKAGSFKVTEPFQSSGTYTFDAIPPGGSQIVMVPAPWLSGDYTTPFAFTINNGDIVKNVNRTLSALTAVKAGSAMTVDGDLTGPEWDNAMSFTLDTASDYQHITGTDWGGPDDLSVTGKVKWDDTYLYMGVAVSDDVQYNANGPDSWWMGDGLQVCIDPYRNFGYGVNGFDFFGFATSTGSPLTAEVEASVPGTSPMDGLLSAVKRDDVNHMTYYEVAFKWSSILPQSVYSQFMAGYTDVGFALVANDNDNNGEGRRGFMQYMGGIGYGRDATQWGDLILTNSASFDAPTPPNPNDPDYWKIPAKPDPPFVPQKDITVVDYSPTSQAAGNPPQGVLFDSNIDTYWGDIGANDRTLDKYITLDLGKDYDVDGIWYWTQRDYDGGMIFNYNVYIGDDPSNMTLLVSNAAAPSYPVDQFVQTSQTIGEYNLQFPDGIHGVGRYVKLEPLSTKYDDWRMAELNVHYIPPTGPVLTGIEVAAPPDKVNYVYGSDYNALADIDLTGIEVLAHYDNQDDVTLGAGDVTAESIAPSAAGGNAYTVTISYQGKTAAFDVNIADMPAPVITGIEITALPTTVAYTYPDDVDLTGLVVTVNYDYGPSKTVGPDDVTIVDETHAPGNSAIYYVTIGYGGFTATFQITRQGVLIGISITMPPTTTTYYHGESIDLTGCRITQIYNDGFNKVTIISSNSWWMGFNEVSETPVPGSTDHEYTVTIGYGDTGFTDSFSIWRPIATTLTITTPPATTTYYHGEAINLTGIAASVTYSDGYSEAAGAADLTLVSETPVTSPDHQSLVTVSCQGLTGTFTIYRPALQSLTLITPPTTLKYYHGEAVDLAGIAANAVYSDGHAEALTAADLSVQSETAVAGSASYEYTVVVAYQGMTASFVITRPAATGIAITTLPNKVSYVGADPLDLTGIGVNVTYSDGYAEVVGANMVTVNAVTQVDADTYEVVVSCMGFQSSFEITRASASARAVFSFMNAAPYAGQGPVSVDSSLFGDNGIVLDGAWLSDPVPNGLQASFDTVDGCTAYIADNGSADSRFNLSISDTTFWGATDIYVKVIYYDSVGDFKFLACNPSGSWADAGSRNASGAQAWKSATFHLTGALVHDGKLEGHDLMFYSHNGMAIRTVIVTLTPPGPDVLTLDITSPAKTTYAVGETLDTTGMVVKAVYDDGTSAVLNPGEYALTADAFDSAGTKNVWIAYQDIKLPFAVNVEGEASSPVLTSIKVDTMPDKTEYNVGDALDLTGLGVTAVYSDGSEKAVTGYTTDPADGALLDAAGTVTVTVMYAEDGVTFSATFTVTVGDGGLRTIYMPFFELPQGIVTLPGDYYKGVSVWSDGYPADTIGQLEYQYGNMCLIGNNNGMSHNFLVTSPSFIGQSDVYMKIEYYDASANTDNWFNYPNGSDRGNEGNQKYIRCTGTQEWTSEIFHFTDARFGEALFGGTKDMTLSLRRLPIKSITISLDPIAPDVTGIEIVTPPAKLDYQAGEALDLTGLSVKAYDNTETGYAMIGMDDVTVVSETQIGSSGTYEVVVSYMGFQASFEITRTAAAARDVFSFMNAAPFAGQGSVTVPSNLFDDNGIAAGGSWQSDSVPVGFQASFDTVDGCTAWVAPEDQEGRFGVYSTDPMFLNAPDVYVKIIYYDVPYQSGNVGGRDRESGFRFIDSSWADKGSVVTGGTNTWKSATFHLTNTTFGQRALEGNDLYIYGYFGVPIRTVIFSLTPPGPDVMTLDITPPDTTAYAVGGTLDTTGMVVKAVYDDGTSAVLDEGDYTLTADSLDSAGTKNVWISYQDITLGFTVDVENGAPTPAVTGLTVAAPPDTTTYTAAAGAALDLTGLTVSVTYDQAESDATYAYPDGEGTAYTVDASNVDLATPGTYTVTVTSVENPDFSDSFTITVKAAFVPDYAKYDINGDGKIDSADLALIMANLNKKASTNAITKKCDIDGNGIVDMNDYALLAAYIQLIAENM